VLKMSAKYLVELTSDEKDHLLKLVREGKTQGYRIRHAQILLALDRSQGQNWFYDDISKAYRSNPCTITEIAKRFVLEGLEAALGRREQKNRRRKVDGEVEAHIVAIACSETPEGRERWTLQLIADELARLGVVESISDTAVMDTLKKTSLSLGRRKNGVSLNREQSS
jgi:transposase